jgi:hypothetical protein
MRRLALVLLAALVLAGCAARSTLPVSVFTPSATPTGAYSPPASPGAGDVPGIPAASAAPLQTAHDPGQVTGTLAGPCRYRGTAPQYLPDPGCTPGSYDPAVTAAVICAHGFTTRGYRPPEADTERFKFGDAYPAYGVPPGTRTELDHLVPLELGGDNSAANLWPEVPPTPNPKDAVEGALHQWVCAAPASQQQGRLASAQQAIAADWITAEAVLGVGHTP